jgi:hypothetical protein
MGADLEGESVTVSMFEIERSRCRGTNLEICRCHRLAAHAVRAH